MSSTAIAGQREIRLLPAGHSFPAAPGESILEAGRRAGYSFPSACRNGNCLRCEGRLLAGEVEHLRSGQRTAVGGDPTVLPCIVTPKGNCTLAIDGVFAPGEMPQVTVPAQVVALDLPAGGIACVQLRLPAGRRVARLAGQYLEILDGGEAFAFSMASPPESGRDLELHVRFGDDNPSSLRVMELLRREPVVTLRLPMGDCTLVGEPRLPLLFIAGATGFSQVKAFVAHAIAQGWHVPISLYWGARSPEDLYQRALAEAWAHDHANIRFVPVVSSAAWPSALPKGTRSGLVHEAVLADAPDFTNLLVYACGSPPMVYAARDAFVACGLPPERMFSDVFAWAPRDQDADRVP